MTFAIVATATLPFYGAVQIDEAARAREETIVSRNIALWISDNEASLSSWTIWDEPIAKLDNQADLEWTDRNIGQSVMGTSSNKFVAVIDGSDDLFYSRMHESVALQPFFSRGTAAILRDAKPMLASVRARENGTRSEGIPRPVAASRIEVVNEQAVLITASLFQPDFRTAVPKGRHAPVLVTVLPIEGGLVSVFGDRFLLDDPRISTASSVSSERAGVAVALKADGEPMLMSWRAPRPAADLIRSSFPVILVSALAFVLCALVTLRISKETARTLVNREREMRHAATHDFLTGLPNRSLVQPRFAEAIAKGRVAVVCLDLDGFKPINDRYGHATGDDVLRLVANRLGAATRTEDTVFRLGGDEFALLMPGLSDEEAAIACRRLACVIAEPMDLAGAVMKVEASFGVVGVVEACCNAPVALDLADAALYRAKAGPIGSVVIWTASASAPAAASASHRPNRPLTFAAPVP